MGVAEDASPDGSTIRVQVLLAARGGCRGELADVVAGIGADASARLGDTARVMVLTEIDDDPFPAANPLCRPFDAVVEVQARQEVGQDALFEALAGTRERIGEVAHRDLSAVAVGTAQDLLPCEPTPLRYLYVMRRRAHTTHAQYIDYYFHHHSRFGFATPNIAGYTQFHIDSAASTVAASVLGIPRSGADSVSELHLDSLESFFAGIGDGRLGVEAGADEETFVDRDNSVSFCTTAQVVR